MQKLCKLNMITELNCAAHTKSGGLHSADTKLKGKSCEIWSS